MLLLEHYCLICWLTNEIRTSFSCGLISLSKNISILYCLLLLITSYNYVHTIGLNLLPRSELTISACRTSATSTSGWWARSWGRGWPRWTQGRSKISEVSFISTRQRSVAEISHTLVLRRFAISIDYLIRSIILQSHAHSVRPLCSQEHFYWTIRSFIFLYLFISYTLIF